MAGSTIDVGIDLGTTNSALALMQKGHPYVVPNYLGEPTTPSVVRVDQNGGVTVGRRASDWLMREPDSTKAEFKLLMGQPEGLEFAGVDRSLTPVELSSEVLKALLGDLQRYIGSTAASAVVTVPAAFDLNQCAATEESARLAGLEHTLLLQEPIAALLAFGYRLDLDEKSWLVYDFGGGTFDLALVQIRDGRAEVVDHEGDNHLGGKNLDWLLVEDILVPRLAETHPVESFTRSNPDRRSTLAKLKVLAEQTKIDLTRADSAILSTDLMREPLLDDLGNEIDVDISVTREEFESAIFDLVLRSAELSKSVVDRNPDVAPEAILMVGGSTLVPLVRSMVAELLGVPVNTSTNPMTAIAEGAAWYAAAQPAPKRSRPVEIRESPPNGAVTIVLEFQRVTDDDEALVGLSAPPPAAAVRFAATDRTWASAQFPLVDGRVITRLPLPTKGVHEFTLEVTDANGSILDAEPSDITITRGLAAAAAPLSKTLSVVFEGSGGELQLLQLIRRGAALPASGSHEFRTTLQLEPGNDSTVLGIHIVEGESLDPFRNRKVGEIIISGSGVDRRMPPGTPIEVTIEIDESRLPRASAFLPLIDRTFAAEIRQEHDTATPESIRKQVQAEQSRIDDLSPHLSPEVYRRLHSDLSAAERESAAARGGDADAGIASLRLVQRVQERLDEVDRAQEFPTVLAEARSEAEATTEVVGRSGDEGHRARLGALSEELNLAVSRSSIRDVRRVEGRMAGLRFELLRDQPLWWIEFYQFLASGDHGWVDEAQAQTLLRQGRTDIEREDFDSLRQTVVSLYRLLPQSELGQAAEYRHVGIGL